MVLIKKPKPIFNELSLSETLNYIDEVACAFADRIAILKEHEVTYSVQVNNLLSAETLERYKSNAKVLKYPYNNFLENLESAELSEGFLVQSWSCMGSILETTLQIFLAFYYRDYINTEVNVWDEQVKARLKALVSDDWNNQLKMLVENQEITFSDKDRKSFLEKIYKIIEDKNLPLIEKMTLEPLIAFYFTNGIIEPKEYTDEELRRIRDYRNSIHSFQKRKIGNWDELNHYGKVLLMVLIDMYSRIPDIPDEAPLTRKMHEAQQRVTQLEYQWFEYDVKDRI